MFAPHPENNAYHARPPCKDLPGAGEYLTEKKGSYCDECRMVEFDHHSVTHSIGERFSISVRQPFGICVIVLNSMAKNANGHIKSGCLSV